MKNATKGLMLAILVPALMAGTMPVGSLTTFGQTSISGVNVQSGTAVFAGDVITTGPSSAVFSLPNGRTVQIGPNSALQVSKDSTLSMLKGTSRIQAKSANFVMVASNWKLDGQPGKSGLTADVVSESDGRVSLNVSSGKVVASSNRGNVVMVAEAGRPVMLPSSAPSAGTADPAPAGSGSGSGGGAGSGGGNNKGLIIGAFVVGAVGLAVGAAALAGQPPDNSSQIAALQAQNTASAATITALQASVAALTTQSANLLTNLNALSTAASASAALTTQLNAQISALITAQSALATAQATINGLVAKVASGQALTAADQAALTQAQATVTLQSANLAAAATAANALISQIKNITVPSNFKP